MTPKEFVSSRDDCFFLDKRTQERLDVQVIPFGNLVLDRSVCTIGGVPCGRITEIFSDTGVGKTTALTQLLANAQKMDLTAMLVDAEHAFDPAYSEALGVDNSKLIISQPNCGEEAIDIVLAAINSGAVQLIGVDSVAALTPRAEIEGDMGDAHMGLHARLMGQAMRKLTAAAANNGVAVVFLNQIRQKIGVMFGNPNTTTGGNALKFFSTLRLEFTHVGQIKQGEDRVGHQVRATCIKNKLAPPFSRRVVDFIYGYGFDEARALLDLGLEYTDSVTLKASKWTIEGDTFTGRHAAADHLRENPEVAERLRTAIEAAMDQPPADEEPYEETSEASATEAEA